MEPFPSTPIVELYDELHGAGIGREERLALAQGYVAVPCALAALFADSVRRLASYQPTDEYFYEGERTAERGDQVTKTHHVALRLKDAQTCSVGQGDGHPPLTPPPHGVREVPAEDLSFHYIDRELLVSRTTGGIEKEGTAVRLDLLLGATSDDTAIIGELKIKTDKDAFSALVQAMACAAHLVSGPQYSRLRKHARRERPDVELRDLPDGPFLDLYVVLHDFSRDTWLPELREETEKLSARLLGAGGVNQHVRRIACLLTETVDDRIVARRHFAFERP